MSYFRDTRARYAERKQLGEGGTAFVEQAIDTWSGRAVVLKSARQAGFDQEFRNEAELLGKLVSGVFPRLLEYHPGNNEDPATLVLERRPGTPARETHLLDPKELPWIAVQILQGLAELGRAGCVHGDLSPENVLISGSRASLIDLGFARKYNEQLSTRSGTPGSIPPEVLAEKTLHETSDIFSLGVVLYHLLCGHAPFPEDPQEAIRDTLAGRFREPENSANDPFMSVIQRCLAIDPNKRPKPDELLKELLADLPGDQLALLVPKTPMAAELLSAQREISNAIQSGQSLLIQGPDGSGKRYALSHAMLLMELDGKRILHLPLPAGSITPFLWARFGHHPAMEKYPELRDHLALRDATTGSLVQKGLIKQLFAFFDELSDGSCIGIVLDLNKGSDDCEILVKCAAQLARVQGRQLVVVMDGQACDTASKLLDVHSLPMPSPKRFHELLELPAPGLSLSGDLLLTLDQLCDSHASRALDTLRRNLGQGRLQRDGDTWQVHAQGLIAASDWTLNDLLVLQDPERRLLSECAIWQPAATQMLWQGWLEAEHDPRTLDHLQARGLLRDRGDGVPEPIMAVRKLLQEMPNGPAHERLLLWLELQEGVERDLLFVHLAGAGIRRAGKQRTLRILTDDTNLVRPDLTLDLLSDLVDLVEGKDRIACLQQLFDAQFELGTLDAARDTLRRMLCLNGFRTESDRISALSKLAHLYRRIKKPRLACRVLRDASRGTDGIDLISLQAQLAEAEVESGWTERARQRYRDTLSMYQSKEPENDKSDLFVVNVLAGLAFRFGAYEDAAQLWELQLRKHQDRISGRQRVWLLNNLGIVRLQEGRLDRARELLEQASRSAEELHLENSQLMARVNLATTYTRRGEPDRAIRELDQSLVLAQQLGHSNYELVILHNRGEALYNLGLIRDALQDWNCELDLADQIRQPSERLDPLREQLMLYVDLDLEADPNVELNLRQLSEDLGDYHALVEWMIAASWRKPTQEAIEDLELAESLLDPQDQQDLHRLIKSLRSFRLQQTRSSELRTRLLRLPSGAERLRHALYFASYMQEDRQRLVWLEQVTRDQHPGLIHRIWIDLLTGGAHYMRGDYVAAGRALGRGTNAVRGLVSHMPAELADRLCESKRLMTALERAEDCLKRLS